MDDVIFKRFRVDLDMSHHEISITSQRIELQKFESELSYGLPLKIEICLGLMKNIFFDLIIQIWMKKGECFELILWFLLLAGLIYYP